MDKSRLGTLILGVATIAAVTADLSRMSGGNESAVDVRTSATPALAATQDTTSYDEAKTTTKVLEVPSIFVDGREFFNTAYQQRVSVPPHVQKQLAIRPMPTGQSALRRKLVSQQPKIDINATRIEASRLAAIRPLYVVQKRPEHSRFRRLVTHMLGGIHERWISWRGRNSSGADLKTSAR